MRRCMLATSAMALLFSAPISHAGPYAPAAGTAGSTAVPANAPYISAWATGFSNYIPGPNVTVPWNDPFLALGPAGMGEFDIVSLGDGGQITLSFPSPIRNVVGDDFAVFENSFNATFLELAFVEVSDDGVNFRRFASRSLTADPVPFIGATMDPTNIDGLAGKYGFGFGVPFDLAAVGLDQATHVRLVDILGDGSVLDSAGSPIYDPTPTVQSGGFDLDGVAVIPEPSMGLLGIAGIVLLAARRR